MQKPLTYIFLPTDKPSNIMLKGKYLYYSQELWSSFGKDKAMHLYILSDDEIKESDWIYCHNSIQKATKIHTFNGIQIESGVKNIPDGNPEWFTIAKEQCKKIIATTNRELEIRVREKPNYDDGATLDYIGHHIYKLPKISQSDIEYIISLHNGTEEKRESGLEKLFEEYADVWTERDKKIAEAAYNTALQSNAGKKFTLGDVEKVAVGLSDWALDKGVTGRQGEDSHDVFDRLIQSLGKSKSNKDTVMVEYENVNSGWQQMANSGKIGSTIVPDKYAPKLKDGCIVISR